MARGIFQAIIFVVLTLLTQLGGLAWLIARLFRRRALAFVLSYAALSVSALWLAPIFGRVPVSCLSDDTYRMHSPLYCVLNRQYVTPELEAVIADLAEGVDRAFPGTTTLVLDANFPYLPGFPLLPHLSHSDGRKVDTAFYYRDETGYLPGKTRSPLGYFAFQDGPTACPDNRLTLRWDLDWLQGVWPDYRLEPKRMTEALRLLRDDPRVGKVFVEPHLKARFLPGAEKIRFQGCRAARHDDHIHFQL